MPLAFAFLYDKGKLTNLGTLPGDDYSSAMNINDLGQVVGVSGDTGVDDGTAFIYDSNTGMTDKSKLLPTDAYSFASDINNKSQVVGYSGDRAFLYTDGVMQDLNTLIDKNLGLTLSGATAINDKGQIVGFGINNRKQRSAFLLTPFIC